MTLQRCGSINDRIGIDKGVSCREIELWANEQLLLGDCEKKNQPGISSSESVMAALVLNWDADAVEHHGAAFGATAIRRLIFSKALLIKTLSDGLGL